MLFDLKQDQVGESGANCVKNERANKLSQLRVEYSMKQHNEKRMAAMSSFTLTKKNEIRNDERLQLLLKNRYESMRFLF